MKLDAVVELPASCGQVCPLRKPRSRSAWRTHRRSDSGVQPTLPAIEAIAAHCDP